MKVSKKIETLFAHAVALEQSGRLRNTVYCIEDEIYILNPDNTVLLQINVGEQVFDEPVSFRANDYESNKFYVEDGKIVFETRAEGFVRKKRCGVPEANPEDVRDMFNEFERAPRSAPTVKLHKGVLKVLDDNLSHIEFSGDENGLQIIQRNIYDGSTVDITREAPKGLMEVTKDIFPTEFGPIGMRTNDFFALFVFFDTIEFSFTEWGYCTILASKAGIVMQGLVSWCLYDEMGIVDAIIEGVRKNGRKKSEERVGEQEASGPPRRTKQKGQSRRTK